MPRKTARKGAAEIKRELGVVERELGHMIQIQWTYAKRMLKFGFASWIFGISAFFSSLLLMNAALIPFTPPISISLLIFAAAVPVIITVSLIQKFRIRIKRLERTRTMLLDEYERAILKRVGEIVK